MITLYTWSRNGVGLLDALDSFAEARDEPVPVLLYGYQDCRFARFGPGGLLDRKGNPLEPRDYFEARAFHLDAELRWVNSHDPEPGRAVILAEKNPNRLEWGDPTEVDVVKVLERQYLLWGQGLGSETDGWGTLAENQIGKLEVPHGVHEKGRLALHAREYVKTFQDGNAAVFEERITELGDER